MVAVDVSTLDHRVAMASRKHLPRNFQEAFTKKLFHETGVAVTTNPFKKEAMENRLQVKDRLNGYADDDQQPVSAGASPPPEGNVGSWSDDADELMSLVRSLGKKDVNLASEQFLKPFFKHLSLTELHIRELDDDVSKFTNLTFLDVSRNELTCIDSLPPSLKYLKAYNNPISQVSCRPLASLHFLGIGYTNLGADGFEQAARRFKNLFALDACFSQVSDLYSVFTPLTPLTKLRQLHLGGCPVSLLPFYRLQVFRWLPHIHVLDGVAQTDEEQADVNILVASHEKLRPRPETIRVGFQLKQLTGARALLATVAEDILAARRAATPEDPERDSPVPADEENTDDIVKACDGGYCRFRIEMPDGSFTPSAELQLNAEDAAAFAAAADMDTNCLFDDHELQYLKTESGGAFYFDIPVGEEGLDNEDVVQDGLVRLCRYLQKGVAIKVFFRETWEPPEVEPTNAAQAEGEGEQEGEVEEPPQPEPPAEIDLGGTVISLHKFLQCTQTGVSDEARANGKLQDTPTPWELGTVETIVVPVERWLDPEVQVPPIPGKASKRSSRGDGHAMLNLAIVFHAGDAPIIEDAPPPPAQNAKGKKPGKK